MHFDELDQALNAEVGGRQDAALNFYLAGDVPQPIFVFAELFGNGRVRACPRLSPNDSGREWDGRASKTSRPCGQQRALVHDHR